MSQATNINVATTQTVGRTEPVNFTAEMNAIFNAFLSSHSGAIRPAYAVAGLVWTDTDTGQQFYFDGTNDLPICRWVAAAPATAADAGQPGDIFVDASWLYVCQASGVWLRVAIATW